MHTHILVIYSHKDNALLLIIFLGLRVGRFAGGLGHAVVLVAGVIVAHINDYD